MKTLTKIIMMMAITFGSMTIKAQQVPMYTHYMYNTLVVNPGYAGSRDALTVTALHRSQWVGFDGAPTTQTLTLHAPLTNQHIGLGFAVMNDKLGPVNNTSFVADFAYRIQLSEKSKLAFGVSAGANLFQANLNTLQLDQQNDPVFLTNINNRVTPNVGFGLYYSRERFYAGVSTPDLIQNTYSQKVMPDGNSLIAKEQRHYFFIAGSMIKLGENLAFKPTMLVKVIPSAPIEGDFTASFVIMNRLLLGAMVRTGDALGGLIGIDITEQLHVGYSYDWSYGLRTFKYNGGSHEIILRYDFLCIGKKQIHSPRYF